MLKKPPIFKWPLDAILFVLVVCVILVAADECRADPELTYCKNGKGEVVIVDNYTCPPGFWRM